MTSCATRQLYENGQAKQDLKIRYLAEGPQPIEVYGRSYCLRYKNNLFQLMGYDRFENKPNKIIIWMNDDLKIPNRYQIMHGDEFILSGEIIELKTVGILTEKVIILGRVATFKAIEIKPIPIEAKIILTPFALAADISSFPFLLLTSPNAAGEIIKIGAQSLRL